MKRFLSSFDGDNICRMASSFHPNIPNKIMVLVKKSNQTGTYVDFWLSENGGITFAQCTSAFVSPNNFTEYMLELEWSKAHDDIFYIAGKAIGKMVLLPNNHINFMIFPNMNYHVDVRFLQTFQKASYVDGKAFYIDLVYQGNDGGVTKGLEDQTTGMIWDDISGLAPLDGQTGLNITQYYGLAITEKDPNYLIGGTQDGNLLFRHMNKWQNDPTGHIGDAAEAVIDYNDPNNVYVVTFCGSRSYLKQSKDKGYTWDYLYTGMPNEGSNGRRNDAPLEMSKTDPTVLFVGGKEIYKSKGLGNLEFTKISNWNDPSLSFFKSIRVLPNNHNIIIAGREGAYWDNPKPKLYTSSNGGAGWTDITPANGTPYNLSDVGIFDIAISPRLSNNDPVVFYVALDRFNPTKKIFKGTLVGTTVTWENMSTGLPNLPVNCIEIYNGSEDGEMFAGTDVGIYYYSKSIGHWVKYGRGLPVCPVSDLEINYKTNQLFASTFGRGMYVADLCEIGPSEANIIITGTEVWDNDKIRRIPADIIVKSGANLTIKGQVFMKYNKRVLVERGGMLTVDGGILTSYCPTEPWSGIQVMGTSYAGQNPLYQGIVILKNFAEISHARIGVHCLNPKDERDMYPTSGGGIVMANHTTFKDNIVSAQFERYNYTSSASFFKKCDFINTIGMLSGLIGYTPETFIVLNDLSSIFIGGCNFDNTTNLKEIIGIRSNNSHFVVDMQCESSTTPCPKLDQKPSKFINCQYGIHAVSKPGSKTFLVKNSEFINNDCGIYALNTDNVSVNNNQFSINSEGERSTGLFLDVCSSFVVEDNTFSLADDGFNPTRGIIVNHCGELDNTLYRNKFYNTEYGILAQDLNKNKDGSRGLRIKCNTFNNVLVDLAIEKSVNVIGYGIAKEQGSIGDCQKPAGNVFSNTIANPKYYGILNNCDRITYTHHDASINKTLVPGRYTNTSLVDSKLPYNYETCCPKTVTGGGIGVIDQQTLSEKTNAEILESEQLNLIDNGTTEDKVFMVNSAIPDEAILIHSDLLSTSPYVSDTVLATAIEREDLLTNAMIRDIMVANPHSAKSDALLQELDLRFNPMPENMRDEILEGLDTVSIKELRDMQIKIGMANYHYGLNKLISATLNDTSSLVNDSLIYLLVQDGSVESKLKLAWHSFANSDSTIALNQMNLIAQEPGLSTEMIIEIESQKQFMLWLNDNTIIDSTNIEQLFLYSESSSSKVASMALSYLVSDSLIVYNEPYLLPATLKSSTVPEVKEVKHNSVELIKVYPNPAKNFITVEFACEQPTPYYIYIYDEVGKFIKSTKVQHKRTNYVIDTKDLKSGTYFIRVASDSQSLSTTRFTIIK